MKRFLVLLLCVAFVMTSFASFAEEQPAAGTEQPPVEIPQEGLVQPPVEIPAVGTETPPAQVPETEMVQPPAEIPAIVAEQPIEETKVVVEEAEKTVTDSTSTQQIIQTVVGEENISEEEIEAAAKIEGMEAIEAEQNSVVSSVYNTNEINDKNIAQMVTAIKKYLDVRDKYYKAVLLKIKEVSQIQNKALARKVIVRLEQKVQAQKEIDRRIHNKIERILKYAKKIENTQRVEKIKEAVNAQKIKNAEKTKNANDAQKIKNTEKIKNAKEAKVEEKDAVNHKEQFAYKNEIKAIMQKYYKHRQLIIHIDNMIKKLKLALYKEQVVKLTQFANQLEKAKKFNACLRLYEEALKNTDNSGEIYKKIGELNKKIGKKSPSIYVGKKKVNAKVEPFIKNGTTLVPLRAISEALDAEVKWDGKTKTITITKGDKVIQFKLKSKVIKVNGEEKTVEQPADIISGTTVVPLRAVSETLDAKVGWDSKTSIITVEDNFATQAGTISAKEAEEAGIASSSEIQTDITGEEAAEELLSTN